MEYYYLNNIFEEILKKVIKNLIKTFKKENVDIENNLNDLSLTESLEIWGIEILVENLFEVDIAFSPLAEKLNLMTHDGNLTNLGHDIHFTNDIDCLTCVIKIFRFYAHEHDMYITRDGCCIFDKNKKDSKMILEKKYAFLSILEQCVEIFSIDQALKDRAKNMIKNTYKYIRAFFLIEEKDEIKSILDNLKFRLNNLIELEKYNVLDKLITDDTLPDDINRFSAFNYMFESKKTNEIKMIEDDTMPYAGCRLSLSKELLIKNKSELHNIVRNAHNLILDYAREPQFNAITQSNNISMEMNDLKQHQLITSQEFPNQSQYIRPSKAKKLRKRIFKSTKINHQ